VVNGRFYVDHAMELNAVLVGGVGLTHVTISHQRCYHPTPWSKVMRLRTTHNFMVELSASAGASADFIALGSAVSSF
jgi:hypothetical protein